MYRIDSEIGTIFVCEDCLELIASDSDAAKTEENEQCELCGKRNC